MAIAIGVVAVGAVLVWALQPPDELPSATVVDKLVVHKKQRRLALVSRGEVIATYRVSLGGEPVGAKQQEGDERTPEGDYIVDYHNPRSAFFRSLHVSYPNATDAARARARGVSPGGMIMIHGLPPRVGWLGRLHLVADWTDGCVALSNTEMKQVYQVVRDGTPIEIQP